jgi:hypothetical protein
MSEPRPPGSMLEVFLALFFIVLIGGAFLAFLAFITMGALLWVLAVPAGMFALIAVHYVLWGWLVEGFKTEDADSDDEHDRKDRE